MTDPFAKLMPEFADRCKKLLDELAKDNIIMRPDHGFRSMQEQAKLWRKGRSSIIINEKIKSLRIQNCGYLADVLESVGPQQGVRVTHALPGYSWHNWGVALDCDRIVDGKVENEARDVPLYELYANKAKEYGLTAGYFWKKQDARHIQLYDFELQKKYTIQQINDYFRARES